MGKKTNPYSFAYVADIENDTLTVQCKDTEGEVIDERMYDLSAMRSLTFEDQDFGGGSVGSYTFGDWLPLYGLWIHLSARTSSHTGLVKLDEMDKVIALHRSGRFKEKRIGGGIGLSYEIQAVANLKGLSYAEVAKAKATKYKDNWKDVLAGCEGLEAEIQRLKDSDDTVDLL